MPHNGAVLGLICGCRCMQPPHTHVDLLSVFESGENTFTANPTPARGPDCDDVILGVHVTLQPAFSLPLPLLLIRFDANSFLNATHHMDDLDYVLLKLVIGSVSIYNRSQLRTSCSRTRQEPHELRPLFCSERVREG